MSPRVLFLDHTSELGGAELSLLDLTREWEGPRAVLLFADGPFRARLEAAGVPVRLSTADASVLAVRRGSGPLAAARSIPGLLGLARRVARAARDFDVLYANSQKALTVGAVASRLARRPLVWHLRDMLTPLHFGRMNRLAATSGANFGARCVIANSQATADAFIAAGGRRALVEVVLNGIDPAPFVAAKASPALVREELRIGSAPLVGVFGRLAPWKGQHVAVEAMAGVPGAHLLVVGGALFGNEPYEQELRALAEARGLRDRVHFTGFTDAVPRLMSAVDVVLHASVSPEPFGRVIVEGMMAGKPVVATAAGGALEIVEDGVTGCLVAPGRAEALAAALARLLAAPQEAARLAANGERLALARFTAQACRRRVQAIVDHVHGTSGR